MSDDLTAAPTVERTGPAWALIRRWPVALVLAVLGAAGGYAVAGTKAAEYTAEARVAVGYGDLSAGAIAGFPTAAEDLASNYSRYVNDRGLIGESPTGGEQAGGVLLAATPIPSSNVIRIIGVSTSQSAAVAGVDQTAKELITAVNDPSGQASPAQLLTKFNAAATTSAQADSAADQAKTAFAEVQARARKTPAQLAVLNQNLVSTSAASAEADLKKSALQSQYLSAVDASQSADLVLVNRGSITADDSSSRQQRFALIGLALGVVLALVIASLLERRKLRKARVTFTGRHAEDGG